MAKTLTKTETKISTKTGVAILVATTLIAGGAMMAVSLPGGIIPTPSPTGPYVFCKDSDGTNQYTKGKVTFSVVKNVVNTSDDLCYGNSAVMESYCDGPYAKSKIINCLNGCKDSACVYCTGNIPKNATLCKDDNTNLSVNTGITLVPTSSNCGIPKCQYFCNAGYSYNATTKTCVAKIVSYRYVDMTCYNGTKLPRQGSSTSCKPKATWMEYAKSLCGCTEDGKLCGAQYANFYEVCN